MRILKTVQSYFPFQERGGTVSKVRALARGLAHRGNEVTVLTADLGIRNRPTDGLALERSPWGWQSKEGGVATIFLPTFAHYRTLTVNPHVIGFCGASLRRFDLVHFYGIYDFLGPAVSWFCRRQGVPYVLEPMGMYRPIVRNLALKKVYHSFLAGRFVAGARYLIATSEQEHQELTEAGIDPSRIVIRRNGVDPPDTLPMRGEFRQRWKIPQDVKVVLFLGRVISKKRPDLLLESFASWAAKSQNGGNAVLVIAGPEENDGFGARLRLGVKELGISERVLFPGPLYDSAKWQAYRDADVFVLPSQNENFGNTAVESAICGTPVIVTKTCGVAPLMKEAGLIVRCEKKELETALARILGDQDFHRRCRDACSQMAERLSWDVPLTETEKLYERCIAQQVPAEAVA